jgi:hypothetical protein
MEDFSTKSNKRTASLPSPCPKACGAPAPLCQALCSSDHARPQPHAGSTHHWDHCPSGHVRPQLCAGCMLCRDPQPSGPAVPQLCVGLLDPHPAGIPRPLGHTRPQLHAGSTPLWDPCLSGPAPVKLRQLHPPTQAGIPAHCRAPALQACQITTPTGSHSGHHWRAANLPKRHTQTGMDAKGITSEQLRLQFYCSRTVNFFSPSLKFWLSDLLFELPLSLPLFSFLLSFFYLSFSFSFLSFSLVFVCINIVTQLILNYT